MTERCSCSARLPFGAVFGEAHVHTWTSGPRGRVFTIPSSRRNPAKLSPNLARVGAVTGFKYSFTECALPTYIHTHERVQQLRACSQ